MARVILKFREWLFSRVVIVGLLIIVQVAMLAVVVLRLSRYFAIFYGIFMLLSVVMTLVVINKEENPSYKLAWMCLLLALPVSGMILFCLWGGTHQAKSLSMRKVPPIRERESTRMESEANLARLRRQSPEWGRLAAYLQKRGFLLYRNTDAKYFPDGTAFFDDLIDRMQEAEVYIFLEYYILAEGQIWNRIFSVLKERAAHGVEVRIIFDDFGNITRLSDEMLQAMQDAGIEVAVFNPVHRYVNRLYFNYRDHRKIAVIDGDIAYTGGANLADEYANLIVRFGYWKDCGIRLEGEGAWGLTRQFMYLWLRMGGELRESWDSYRPRTAPEGGEFCQPLVDGPDNNPVNTAEDTFQQLISNANRYIWITTPYLAIDEPMIRTLCIAADSGVDVRLMLPGIPDHKFAYMVALSYFGELLEHDVKIFTYTPGLLHAKSVVADGDVGFVGSVNMDYRSFQLHFECGVLFSGSAVTAVQEDMDRVMAQSERVTLQGWRERKWYVRLLGTVLRPFAMWM